MFHLVQASLGLTQLSVQRESSSEFKVAAAGNSFFTCVQSRC